MISWRNFADRKVKRPCGLIDQRISRLLPWPPPRPPEETKEIRETSSLARQTSAFVGVSLYPHRGQEMEVIDLPSGAFGAKWEEETRVIRGTGSPFRVHVSRSFALEAHDPSPAGEQRT